jgi:hypothetical protein
MPYSTSTPALRGALAGRLCNRLTAVALIAFSLLAPLANIRAQNLTPAPSAISPLSARDENTGFRVETTKVEGGAELITILALRTYMDGPMQGPPSDIPLVSVLKDTLGDDKPENDRLRYVWMLTHTKPTFKQKVSALVPFLYTRTANKTKIGDDPPPPILDLNATDKAMWNRAFWTIFKRLVFDDVGVGVKASTLQYRQNTADYRRSGVAAAMAVLELYQQMEGERVLSDKELTDIQARLSLTEKMFGFMMQSENLGRVYDKESALTVDYRGHNWELLRQYTEAQGLYFEPLAMPDGTARHAIVWVSAADLQANKERKFERRFLNIKSPWSDSKLLDWKGHSEVRWYDSEDREVAPDTPDARPKTLIPLAIYGLDHPKVPVILVDFRDNANPKVREISRRILNDLTGNVLSISKFGGMPFFLGRFVYDFVTGRRGADLNQTSRLRSYSQLKLLLALDDSLDRELKQDVAARIESSTLNPLQNDAEVEIRLARVQYENLRAYAADPEGLPKKIKNDRREEMGRLVHSGKMRAFFAFGSLVTLGKYAHRETETPELLARLDDRRQLDYHERFLREVAFASVDPEIDSRPGEIKRSLAFVSRNGAEATEKTTRALSKIFAISKDEDIQTLCLTGLYRVNSSAAKKELLAIYKNTVLPDRWRNISAHYLRLALHEKQRMSVSDARVVAEFTAN